MRSELDELIARGGLGAETLLSVAAEGAAVILERLILRAARDRG